MMSRAIPKKMTELGRIRIGDREPNKGGKGTHPHKLDVFRLTSPNSPLLHFAAGIYGGEVQPWTGEGAPKDDHDRPTQFELYTTVNALDVLIPTFSAVSLGFELWSAGGCQRRCTGEVLTHCPANEALVGTACTCPADDHERSELAKTGKACARILRLNVILPDLPGMGSWRLETKGFYATAELMGTLDMLQMAGQEHSIIEAALRLEQRTVKRPGEGKNNTFRFVVPVLWPKFTPRQMLASAAQRGMLLMSPPAPTAPKQLLAKNIADLYGDSPTAEGDGCALLRTEIDAILTAQGVSDTQRSAWWAKHAGRMEPTYLNYLKEKLLDAAAKKAQQAPPVNVTTGEVLDEMPHGDPDTPLTAGDEEPDLWAQEAAAERQ